MNQSPHPTTPDALKLRPILRPPRIQTLILAIGGVGTRPPTAWIDPSRTSTPDKPWFDHIPPSVTPGLGVFQYSHGLTSQNFSSQALAAEGEALIGALRYLFADLEQCPTILLSHGVGGVIVKEALGIASGTAHPDSQLLEEILAGVILLDTPHFRHGNATNRTMASLILPSMSRPSIGEAVTALVHTSTRFEQVSGRLPILSVHGTKQSKVATNLLLSKNFALNAQAVATYSLREYILRIETDHKSLCNLNTADESFLILCRFINTSVEPLRRELLTLSRDMYHTSTMSSLTEESDHLEPMPDPKDKQTNQATMGSSNRGYEAVLSTAGFLIPNRRDTDPPHYDLPRARNNRFFGRENVLAAIDAHFFSQTAMEQPSGPETKTFTISGIGGIGKTEVAAEYVHRRKARFDTILWISAESRSMVGQEFSRLAVALDLVAPDSVDALDFVICRAMVKGWLSNLEKGDNPSRRKAFWLVVIDNADDMEVLAEIWPLHGSGCVLVTSRDPSAISSAMLGNSGLDLPPFSRDESTAFLAQLTNYGGCEEIYERIGGLPLALAQIGGLIHRRHLSPQEFTCLYDDYEGRINILRTDIRGGRAPYEHNLWSALNIEALQSRPLLNIISMFNPDNIPETIFKDHGMKLVPRYSLSHAAYFEARSELMRMSLIKRDVAANNIVIHRIVQDLVRSKMNEEEFFWAFSSALKLLRSAWPYESESHASSNPTSSSRPAYQPLLPHVVSLQHASKQLNFKKGSFSREVFDARLALAGLLLSAGHYCYEDGLSVESRQLLDHVSVLSSSLSRQLVDCPNEVLDKVSIATQIDSMRFAVSKYEHLAAERHVLSEAEIKDGPESKQSAAGGESVVLLRNAIGRNAPRSPYLISDGDSIILDDSLSEPSTFSLAPSLASVKGDLASSQTTPELLISGSRAWAQFLIEDPKVGGLCKEILKTTQEVEERLERNLGRLLTWFAEELAAEAEEKEVTVSAIYLKNRRKQIAREVIRHSSPKEGHIVLPKDVRPVEETVGSYLRSLKHDSIHLPYPRDLDMHPEGDEQVPVEEQFPDEETEPDVDDDQLALATFDAVKYFILNSNALEKFREDLYEFIYPTFRSEWQVLIRQYASAAGTRGSFLEDRLYSLGVALDGADINSILISSKPQKLDKWKLEIENATSAEWTWWPFLDPPRHCYGGGNHVVSWLCVS
ncbi:hypothetical protein GQ53DRAFT_803534 [Thozetella sp. PMI_491]|nr:hypothetical protein GQ53DRAFT_803534 [Thozetella sp. PMI_491]